MRMRSVPVVRFTTNSRFNEMNKELEEITKIKNTTKLVLKCCFFIICDIL